MLAGAEPVRGKIHAFAGEPPPGHVADFHRVRHARGALDAEAREHGFSGFAVADDETLRLRTQPAAVDLVCVGGAPIVGRWNRDFPAGRRLFAGHGTGKMCHYFRVVQRFITALLPRPKESVVVWRRKDLAHTDGEVFVLNDEPRIPAKFPATRGVWVVGE